MRPDLPGKAFARARRLAKHTGDVQPRHAVPPALARVHKTLKSRRISRRLFALFGRGGRSEPPGAILSAVLFTVAVAVHAAFPGAVAPALVTAEAAMHMGQDPEAALLAVIQGFV